MLIAGWRNNKKQITATADGDKERLDVASAVIGTLVPYDFDYISISYTGSDMTGVVYKTGGSSGATVATLTITYNTAGGMATVTRT